MHAHVRPLRDMPRKDDRMPLIAVSGRETDRGEPLCLHMALVLSCYEELWAHEVLCSHAALCRTNFPHRIPATHSHCRLVTHAVGTLRREKYGFGDAWTCVMCSRHLKLLAVPLWRPVALPSILHIDNSRTLATLHVKCPAVHDRVQCTMMLHENGAARFDSRTLEISRE